MNVHGPKLVRKKSYCRITLSINLLLNVCAPCPTAVCSGFHRNSDRLGNGVLYASVNPEYFSAAESKSTPHCPPARVCVCTRDQIVTILDVYQMLDSGRICETPVCGF